MNRWMLGGVAVFFLIFVLTALLTGEPTFIIPVGILALLALGYGLVNHLLTRRMVQRHGSVEEAMASRDEQIPSTHLTVDDQTPAGDTPEAHDEINPHDLPMDHPGRKAAEAQAGGEQGTTGGG